jgi:protein phosphatase PTC1
MVVRFDGKHMREYVEHKVDPVGVDGDPSSNKPGGISEADAIVKETKQSMHLPDGELSQREFDQISQQIIQEEQDMETGPEIQLGGAATEPAKAS